MEEYLVARSTGDWVLFQLVELALVEIRERRPVFPNPLDEPVLYRRFKGWVHSGLAMAHASQDAQDQVSRLVAAGGA